MELNSKVQTQKVFTKKRKISEFIVDETLIKVGNEFIWLWVAIEPKNKEILASISKEESMSVAEIYCWFIRGLWETARFNRW